jgi:hypothetical protein
VAGLPLNQGFPLQRDLAGTLLTMDEAVDDAISTERTMALLLCCLLDALYW